MSERLEEIKERYEKNKLQTLPLTNEQCKWLINRVEELEKNLEHGAKVAVKTAEKLHHAQLENQRYKQALEQIYKDTFYKTEHELVSPIHVIRKRAEKALEGEE